MAAHKRLDQILQTRGLVSETKIRDALSRQGMLGGKLGEHLLRAGDVREIELVGALSEQFGVPGVCLTGRQIDPALFDILPRALAETHHCVPLTFNEASATLDVAFADPSDGDAPRAIGEAIHPTRVRAFVAADTSIHAILSQVQRSGAPILLGQADLGRSGASPSDPVISSLTLLLELAVRAIDRGGKVWACDSVWSARLAEEMAMRLGLSHGIVQTVRLTALTASSAAWQRPIRGEPLMAVLERSQLFTRTLDLPWDVSGLLAECAHSNDIHPPSPAAQVLRTAFAVGESKPDTLSDQEIKRWREKVTNSVVKWNLAPELIAMAFAIVHDWWQGHQLGDPPREVMIVGVSTLAQALLERLASAKYRYLNVASAPEAILLIRRRAPDIVCVHVPAEGGCTYDELADILGAIPRHFSRALLVVHDKCGARVLDLAGEGLAEVITETDGSDLIFSRIESLLAPQPHADSAPGREVSSSRSRSGRFPSVAGHLEDLGLADLVQVLSAAHKTARVILRRPGQDAILWFHQGQVVSALSGGLTGEEAFFDLVKWRDGTFEVHTTEEAPAKNVGSSTAALLLEGYRRLDESQRDFATLPGG